MENNNVVICAICNKEILETGTSYNDNPVHIKCYHIKADTVDNTEQGKVKTFEVFSESFSTIIQCTGIFDAMVKFKTKNPEASIIAIEDCNYREQNNKPLIKDNKGEEAQKPKVVCYCGSLRVALDAFKKAEYEAVLKGEIALLPCCMFVDIQREYGAESDYKIKADDLHKRKIDISDEVFILNVGVYIGESTRSEIEYAKSISKPIKYLENGNQ